MGKKIVVQNVGKTFSLDIVRGIAIVLVMLHHQFWFTSTGEPELSILKGGWLGVDLFFVLSGFLITSILLKIFYQESSQTLKMFFANRVKRLAPALLVFLSVWTFLVFVNVPQLEWALSSTYNEQPDSIFVPVFLGIVAPIFGFANYAILFFPYPVSLGHLWSLAIEWQFYLFLPLFFVFIQVAKRKFSFPKMLSIFVGTYFVFLAIFIFSTNSPQEAYLESPGRFLSVLSGVIVAILLSPVFGERVSREKCFNKNPLVATIMICIVVIFLLGIWFSADKSIQTNIMWIMPIAGLLSGVLVFFAAQIPNNFFDDLNVGKKKILNHIFVLFSWFGRRSYAAYLWNWTLVFVLYSLVREYPVFVIFDSALLNTLFYLVIAWAATWGLSELSWRFVEKRWILSKKY
jgi:peptidoglycan/LPS O-acetylase OafA/YrhL